MEHQHVMQHRNPMQSHDMMHRPSPRRPSSRPRSRGRNYRGDDSSSAAAATAASTAGADTQHHHIIQNRTSSQSHSLSKRARSRSKGKARQQQQQQQLQQQQQQQQFQQQQQQQHQHDSSFNDSSSYNRFNDSAMSVYLDERKINDYGRCIRHPNIELAVKDPPHFDQWRVLLQDCPLCSLDVVNNDGGGGASNMSQATATPSTKTNPTVTTEEESSVKSWTMSDASDAEEYDSDGNDSKISRPPEQMFPGAGSARKPPPQQRPRPPPPPQHQQTARSMAHQQQQQNQHYHRQQQHMQQQQQGGNHLYEHQNQQYSQQQAQAQAFDPLQSLKALGKKLVEESEQAAAAGGDDISTGMRSSASRRHPPPPPKGRGHSAHGTQDMYRRKDSISSMSTKELSQMKRQSNRNKVRPSPRRETMEASDVIARMESLNQGESPSNNNNFRASRTSTKIGEDAQETIDAIARAENEKKARALRRKEKAERKAARQRERLEMQQQRDQAGGQTYEMPMNDEPQRGRDAHKTDDILQAAASIRARARRSTSRSRERIKEAALFCGESPPDDMGESNHGTGEESDGADHLSMTSEKRRSIMNPHGLEDGPRPVQMERRSQSREKRRSKSDSRKQGGGREPEGAPMASGKRGSTGETRTRRGSRGRDRNKEQNAAYMPNQNNQQQSTAEELLSRRREMRQKIAERQNEVSSRRMEHKRNVSGGNGDEEFSLKEEVLEGWGARGNDQSEAGNSGGRRGREEGRGRERRGRSRSAVRDGLSKMRSASIGAFNKTRKGSKDIGIGVDLDQDNQTMDSSKKSILSSASSIRRMMNRSLSRSRRRSPTNIVVGRRDTTPDGIGGSGGGGWKARSDNFVNETLGHSHTIDNDHNDYRQQRRDSEGLTSEWDIDGRSVGGKSEKSSASRLSMLKRNSLAIKKKTTRGLVRSLSRGSFRARDGEYVHDDRFGGDGGNQQDVIRSANSNPSTPGWAEEVRPVRSTSSGRARGGGGERGRGYSHEFDGF